MSKPKKPIVGKFYYINYEDKEEPDGSYFGIAECVDIFEHDADGELLKDALYEFKHPDASGKMTLSVFYKDEILMEA